MDAEAAANVVSTVFEEAAKALSYEATVNAMATKGLVVMLYTSGLSREILGNYHVKFLETCENPSSMYGV